jgi:hypothetical protein
VAVVAAFTDYSFSGPALRAAAWAVGMAVAAIVIFSVRMRVARRSR